MNIFKPLYEYRSLTTLLIISCLSFNVASGQVSISKTELHGREAYMLENARMSIKMLTGGGYLGEIRLASTDLKTQVNPMRVPHYSTIDPQDYIPDKHDQLYGEGGDRKVMASYMGHFLCFPYVGGSNSKYERQLGYGAHGEAAVVKWDIERIDSNETEGAITASTTLPLSSYKVKRCLTLKPDQSVVLVEEEVENLVTFDRPYQWVHHVTFGNPFVEYGKTYVDAPVSRVVFNPNIDDPLNSNTVQWPKVIMAKGDTLNAGIFSQDKGEGLNRDWLMDPNREYTWFTMYNSDYNILLGYVFSKEENSWIGDWQENGSKKQVPWSGEAVAWGLLVGNSAFVNGVKPSIERGQVYGNRTFNWIGAKEKLKQSYLIFLVEIKDDFKGVEGLHLDNGAIVLTERESTKQIRISCDFSL